MFKNMMKFDDDDDHLCKLNLRGSPVPVDLIRCHFLSRWDIWNFRKGTKECNLFHPQKMLLVNGAAIKSRFPGLHMQSNTQTD